MDTSQGAAAPGEYLVSIWWASDEYRVSTWRVPDKYLVSIWWAPDEYLVSIWRVPGEYTIRETTTKFCTAIKLDARKFLHSRPRMPKRDLFELFAEANLLAL